MSRAAPLESICCVSLKLHGGRSQRGKGKVFVLRGITRPRPAPHPPPPPVCKEKEKMLRLRSSNNFPPALAGSCHSHSRHTQRLLVQKYFDTFGHTNFRTRQLLRHCVFKFRSQVINIRECRGGSHASLSAGHQSASGQPRHLHADAFITCRRAPRRHEYRHAACNTYALKGNGTICP